ncbi:MAG TPA: hypothetical protein VFS23_16845 [Vicinamibacterales bacterium]|nr:hypothetical protein [Vicinamibacterales bacterium]
MASIAAVVAVATIVSTQSPRFYPDDPLWTDNDRVADASKAGAVEDSNGYDFLVNTLGHPGERRDVRALNVNTVDEVPDSSWFTNRIGRMDMSVAEIVRGPDRVERVDITGWQVSGGKTTGVQPGFRMTDPAGQIYQIEVDPPSNPELASGAEMIGTAFYHAIGYNVVDVYLAEIDRDKLVIAEGATIRDPLNGRRRQMKKYDLDDVFNRAARLESGRYRVLVSRFASGTPLGNFRYYSRRPDDPNDLVLHEHRRELRGARVFGAWLNHDDSRGINSLDMLETTNGRAWIKHYMFDFGSILGSGTVYAQRHRPGNEYMFEQKPGWLTLATLGLYVRPWITIDYPDVPSSIGRLESQQFDPLKWKPEYPNAAFENMRPDDAFWAARIVSKFSDAAIRGIVQKAAYSDPAATDFLTKTIIARRDKVVAAWINQVCPVVDVVLAADGTLSFKNAAVDAKAATAPPAYELNWFRFDNATDQRTPVGGAMTVTAGSARAPEGLTTGDFVGVSVKATHAQQPGWSAPSTFIFRRSGTNWSLVGVERGPVAAAKP